MSSIEPGPALDALHDAVEPARALPALGALAAALVPEEVGDDAGRPHHAGGVVHDDDAARAEHELSRSRRNSFAMGTSSCPAGSTGMETPPGITPFTLRPGGAPPACWKTISSSGVPSGSSKRPGRTTCPETPKIVVPGLSFGAEAAEPVGALLQDVRHVAQGLDVVHGGGHAEGAVLPRGRAASCAAGPCAPERLQQARLLAADVGAGAPHEHDVVGELAAQHLLAQHAALAGLVDGALQHRAPPGRTRRGRRRRSSRRGSRRRRSGCPRAAGAAPRSSSRRSLKEPGSDSSALQTR